MAKRPTRIKLKETFAVCPECGYTDGFHVVIQPREKRLIKIYLKCPSCSAQFDPDVILELKK